MALTAAILTISDSAKSGSRADLSGPLLKETLNASGFEVVAHEISADDMAEIESALVRLAGKVRLVVTTGGTGVAPRDVTPEATRNVCEKMIPGYSELMRASGLKRTPFAGLSRAIAGTRGTTLIINTPGSPKGAVDSLQAVLHLVPHTLELLAGKTEH
jgi:molybdopterin adenylyltransferase